MPCKIIITDPTLIKLLNLDSSKLSFDNIEAFREAIDEFIDAQDTDNGPYLKVKYLGTEITLDYIESISLIKGTVSDGTRSIPLHDVVGWVDDKLESKNKITYKVSTDPRYITEDSADFNVVAWESFMKTSTKDIKGGVLDISKEQLAYQKRLFEEVRGREEDYRLVLVKDKPEYWHDNVLTADQLKTTMVLVDWSTSPANKKDILDNAARFQGKIFTVPVETDAVFNKPHYARKVKVRNEKENILDADDLFREESRQMDVIKGQVTAADTYKVFNINKISQGRLTKTPSQTTNLAQYLSHNYKDRTPNTVLDIPTTGLYAQKLVIKINEEEVPFKVNKLTTKEKSFLLDNLFLRGTAGTDKPVLNRAVLPVLQYLLGYRGNSNIVFRLNIDYAKGTANYLNVQGDKVYLKTRRDYELLFNQASRNIDYTLTEEHSNFNTDLGDVFMSDKFFGKAHISKHYPNAKDKADVNSFFRTFLKEAHNGSNTTVGEYVSTVGVPYYLPNKKAGVNTFEKGDVYAYFSIDNEFKEKAYVSPVEETHTASPTSKLEYSSYIDKAFDETGIKIKNLPQPKDTRVGGMFVIKDGVEVIEMYFTENHPQHGDKYKGVLLEEKLHALTVTKLRSILAEDSSHPELKADLQKLLAHAKTLSHPKLDKIFNKEVTEIGQIKELLARGVAVPELVSFFKSESYDANTTFFRKLFNAFKEVLINTFGLDSSHNIYNAVLAYNSYIIDEVVATKPSKTSKPIPVKKGRGRRKGRKNLTSDDISTSDFELGEAELESYNEQIVFVRAMDSYFAQYIRNAAEHPVTGEPLQYSDLSEIETKSILEGFQEYYTEDVDEDTGRLSIISKKLQDDPALFVYWASHPKSFFKNINFSALEVDDETGDVTWSDKNRANNKSMIDRAFLELKFLIGMLPDETASLEEQRRNLGVVPTVSLGKAFVEIKEVTQGMQHVSKMIEALYDKRSDMPYVLDLFYSLGITDVDDNIIYKPDGNIDIDFTSPMIMKFWRSFQMPEIEVKILNKQLDDNGQTKYKFYRETGVQLSTITDYWTTQYRKNQVSQEKIGGHTLEEFYEQGVDEETTATFTKFSDKGIAFLTKKLSRNLNVKDWKEVLKVLGISFTNLTDTGLKETIKHSLGAQGQTLLSAIIKQNDIGIESPIDDIRGFKSNAFALAEYESIESRLKKTQVVTNTKGDDVSANSLNNTLFVMANLINSKAKVSPTANTQYDSDYNDMLSNLESPLYQYSQTKKKMDEGDSKIAIQDYDGFKNITTKNKKGEPIVVDEGDGTESLLYPTKTIIDRRVDTNTTGLNDTDYLEMTLATMALENTTEIMRTETSSSSWSWTVQKKGVTKNLWGKKKSDFSKVIFKDYFKGEGSRIRAELKGRQVEYKGYKTPDLSIFSFIKPSPLSEGESNTPVREDRVNMYNSIMSSIADTSTDLDALYTKSFKVGRRNQSIQSLTEGWLVEAEELLSDKFREFELSKKMAMRLDKKTRDLISRNYIVQQVETSILFAGGVHWYGNTLHKRIKDIVSTGTIAPLDKDFYESHTMGLHDAINSNTTPTKGRLKNKILIVEDHIDSYFNRDTNEPTTPQGLALLSGATKSLKKLLSNIGILKDFTEEDINTSTKELLAGTYGEMEGTDGQSYTSLDFMRMFRVGIGNWSEVEEALYKWEVKFVEEVYLETGEFHKNPDAFELKYNRPEGNFTQEKWQYRGAVDIGLGTGVNNQVFNKTSFKPLVPSTMYGRKAQKLVEKVMKDNISLISTATSIKVGLVKTPGVKGSPIKYFNADGTSNERFDSDEALPETFEFYTNFLKEQILSSNKTKKKSTFGSQFRKLNFPNVKHMGKWIDGKASKLEKRYNKYTNALQEFSRLERKELEKELNLKPNGSGGYIIEDFSYFIDKIGEEADRREMGYAAQQFLDKNKNKKNLEIPFEASFLSQTLETILASIVNKRLVSYKVPGSMLIQTASSGYTLADEAVSARYGATNLRYYESDDGRTTTAQVKIGMTKYWKPLLKNPTVLQLAEELNITPLKALNKLLSNDRSYLEELGDPEYINWKDNNTELYEMIGYRIPTQGLASIDVFSVEEFLPEVEGNIIIPPFEIVAKSGSDYDIDKMTFFYPSFSKDGTYITKEYQKELEQSIAVAEKTLKDKEANLKQLDLDLEEYRELYTSKGIDFDSEKELYKQYIIAKSELWSLNNSVDADLRESITRKVTVLRNQQAIYKSSPEERTVDQRSMWFHIQGLIKVEESQYPTGYLEKRKELKSNITDIKDSMATGTIEVFTVEKNLRKKNNLKQAINTIAKLQKELKDSNKLIEFNKMVEAVKETILDPLMFYQLVSPVDAGTMEGALKSKNKTTTYSNSDNFLLLNNMKKRKDLLESAGLLGIAAISNTFAQLYNKTNAVVKKTFLNRKDVNVDTTPWILTKGERTKLWSKKEKGWQLGGIFNFREDGSGKLDLNSKSGIFNEHVNGTVDAAKDPYMGENNYSMDTMSITQMFALQGVPYNRVVNFITQPFVYKRKELIDKGIPGYKILELTLREMGMFEIAEPYFVMKNNKLQGLDSASIIRDRTKGDSYSVASITGVGRHNLDYSVIDKEEQLFLMAYFQDLQDQADAMFDLQELLKFDTAPDKNAYLAHIKMSLKERYYEEDSIIDKETIKFIIEKSEISSYYIPETIITLFEQSFPKVYNPEFLSKVIEKMEDDRKYIATKVKKDRFMRTYKNDYLEFLVKQFGSWRDKSFLEYFRGEDSLYKTLPREVNEFLAKDSTGIFKDSIFFTEALYVKKNKSQDLVYRVRQDMKEDDLKSAFTETLERLYIVNPDLAMKLAMMAMVETGYNKTGYSWQEILPVNILEQLTVPVMTNPEVTYENTIVDYDSAFDLAHPEYSSEELPDFSQAKYMYDALSDTPTEVLKLKELEKLEVRDVVVETPSVVEIVEPINTTPKLGDNLTKEERDELKDCAGQNDDIPF